MPNIYRIRFEMTWNFIWYFQYRITESNFPSEIECNVYLIYSEQLSEWCSRNSIDFRWMPRKFDISKLLWKWQSQFVASKNRSMGQVFGVGFVMRLGEAASDRITWAFAFWMCVVLLFPKLWKKQSRRPRRNPEGCERGWRWCASWQIVKFPDWFSQTIFSF